jgi:hypothetical protein
MTVALLSLLVHHGIGGTGASVSPSNEIVPPLIAAGSPTVTVN